MADNINLYYHIKVSIGYFDIKLNIISLNYGHDYFKKKKKSLLHKFDNTEMVFFFFFIFYLSRSAQLTNC